MLAKGLRCRARPRLSGTGGSLRAGTPPLTAIQTQPRTNRGGDRRYRRSPPLFQEPRQCAYAARFPALWAIRSLRKNVAWKSRWGFTPSAAKAVGFCPFPVAVVYNGGQGTAFPSYPAPFCVGIPVTAACRCTPEYHRPHTGCGRLQNCSRRWPGTPPARPDPPPRPSGWPASWRG